MRNLTTLTLTACLTAALITGCESTPTRTAVVIFVPLSSSLAGTRPRAAAVDIAVLAISSLPPPCGYPYSSRR